MKTYSEQLKQTIVKLAEAGRPTKELCQEYGVGKSTINTWRRAYKKSGKRQVTSPISAEQKRIRTLERQLADARLERDILKKAVRIFSGND